MNNEKKIQSFAKTIESKDPYLIFLYALTHSSKHLQKLEDAMIELGNVEWICKFALKVQNANTDYLKNAVIDIILDEVKNNKYEYDKPYVPYESRLTDGEWLVTLASDLNNVDKNEILKVLSTTKDGKAIYAFAKANPEKIDGATYAIAKIDSAEQIFKFARNIKGISNKPSNLRLLEKAIVTCSNPEMTYKFAKFIPNANPQNLQLGIIKNCNDYSFAFLKEFKDLDYRQMLLYALSCDTINDYLSAPSLYWREINNHTNMIHKLASKTLHRSYSSSGYKKELNEILSFACQNNDDPILINHICYALGQLKYTDKDDDILLKQVLYSITKLDKEPRDTFLNSLLSHDYLNTSTLDLLMQQDVFDRNAILDYFLQLKKEQDPKLQFSFEARKISTFIKWCTIYPNIDIEKIERKVCEDYIANEINNTTFLRFLQEAKNIDKGRIKNYAIQKQDRKLASFIANNYKRYAEELHEKTNIKKNNLCWE